MNRFVLTTTLLSALLLVGCNSNTTTANTPTTVAAPKVSINDQSSEVQKVGYAVGYDLGLNLREVADDMDLDAFTQGLKDAYAKSNSSLTEEQMQAIVQTYMTRKQEEAQKQLEEKAVTNRQTGEAFLAENAKKDGVKTTASGLQYKVITEGSGTSPSATDTVMVNYEGKLIDGTVFDSSYERGEPIEFPLNQVIPGWTEGLQLMKPGAKYEFYIPSDLAYGEAGNPNIEPNSVLIFTVELLSEADATKARQEIAAGQEAQIKQMMDALQSQQSGSETAPKPSGQ